MTWILFVWLSGNPQLSGESGWLRYPSKAQCEIKRAWYLQRLTLNDGTKATQWVAECLEVNK